MKRGVYQLPKVSMSIIFHLFSMCLIFCYIPLVKAADSKNIKDESTYGSIKTGMKDNLLYDPDSLLFGVKEYTDNIISHVTKGVFTPNIRLGIKQDIFEVGDAINTIDSKIDEQLEEGVSIESKLDYAIPIIEKIYNRTCISEPTTITESNSYILCSNIIGGIIIDANNVTIDLNGYTITATSAGIRVNAFKENIHISNGFIKRGLGSDNGIIIEEGAKGVEIEKVQISDFALTDSASGIYLDGRTSGSEITRCHIEDCRIANCNIGIYAKHIQECSFENVEVKRGIEKGFAFETSEYNSLYQCKALKIKNDDPQKGAVGFSSTDGTGNLFKECVADGIISTTSAFKKNAVGFLLSGDETASKIINSIVNTVEVYGCGSGYGIFLEPIWTYTSEELSALATYTLDKDDVDVDYSVAWSPDGKYLSYAGSFGTGSSFDIIVGVLNFDGSTLSSKATYTLDKGSIDQAYSVAWSPDGKYLSYAGYFWPGGGPTRDILVGVLSFDGSTLSLIDEYTLDKGFGNDRAFSVAWSPDGKYLSYAGYFRNGSNDDDIIVGVLSFDGSTLSLIDEYTLDKGFGHDYAYSVAWSPDGKYLSYAGYFRNGSNDDDIIVGVLSFDGSTLSLIDEYTLDKGFGHDYTLSVAWSPDGKYLSYAGPFHNGSNWDIIVGVLSFDGSTLSAKATYTLDKGSDDIARSVAWSPDGKYLSYAGFFYNGPDIIVEVLSQVMASPSRCKIENNNIDNCKSDVPAGGAIGISGAAGSNLIIKNICYETDIPFSYGVFNTFRGLTGSPDFLDNIAIPPYNFS